MLKSIPNFAASLVGVLASDATVAVITAAGADLLRQKLKSGDWIYACINDDVSYEVVRISGVTGNTVALDRNVEDTGAFSFANGASISYILGQQAVDDVIYDVVTSELDVTGTGAAQVTKTGTFSWNIDVKQLVIKSDDPDIEVIDLYPTFFITKK